jgi:hypothetical protein
MLRPEDIRKPRLVKTACRQARKDTPTHYHLFHPLKKKQKQKQNHRQTILKSNSQTQIRSSSSSRTWAAFRHHNGTASASKSQNPTLPSSTHHYFQTYHPSPPPHQPPPCAPTPRCRRPPPSHTTRRQSSTSALATARLRQEDRPSRPFSPSQGRGSLDAGNGTSKRCIYIKSASVYIYIRGEGGAHLGRQRRGKERGAPMMSAQDSAKKIGGGGATMRPLSHRY